MSFNTKASRRKRKKGCRWSVRRLRVGAASAPIQLIFKFPTEDGSTAELSLPPSELRHPKRLLDRFADFMPVYPAKAGVTDSQRVRFIERMVNGQRTTVEFIPDRTGFIDRNTFATHAEILRANGSRSTIPLEANRQRTQARPSL
jgi:hypothetical protein